MLFEPGTQNRTPNVYGLHLKLKAECHGPCLLLALLGKDGVLGLTFDETGAYFLNKNPEELL